MSKKKKDDIQENENKQNNVEEAAHNAESVADQSTDNVAKNEEISKPTATESEKTEAAPKVKEADVALAAASDTVAVEHGDTNILKRGAKKYGVKRRKRKKKIILPDVVYARNTTKPRIYRVAVDSRRKMTAFPTQGNKAYYVNCMKNMLGYFPIEILAYSLTNDRAYMILASYDQNPVSYKRFLANINTLYSEYYNGLYKGAGYVFGTDTRDKKMKEPSQIAESIAIIHSQPSANNLCEGFDYPYSSYRPNDIISLNALMQLAGGEEAAYKLLDDAHAKGPRLLPADFFAVGKSDSFSTVMENVLIDYGYYSLSSVPNDVMHRIIAEVNERGGFKFKKIVRKMGLRKAFKYEMLVKVIVDLAINKKQVFDESIDNLQIEFMDSYEKRELIKDVVFMVSNRTGYSYDYIMNMFGFAYPNYEFLTEMILYIADMKGISVEAATKKLGIREHLDYVLSLVRSAS